MIGFYNPSVILTYIGLIAGVFGICFSIGGKPEIAVIMLMFSGVCDMFDGKIARMVKRNHEEKRFGIQIDSLCDLICFGALPAVTSYCLGASKTLSVICLALYVLAAIIRLGYFNVTEETRQDQTAEVRQYYQGLPVTSIAVLFPLIMLFRGLLGAAFPIVLSVFMLAVALLFVLDIRVKKVNGAKIYVLLAVGIAVAALYIVFFAKGII